MKEMRRAVKTLVWRGRRRPGNVFMVSCPKLGEAIFGCSFEEKAEMLDH
jgi:hypothetical protein